MSASEQRSGDKQRHFV